MHLVIIRQSRYALENKGNTLGPLPYNQSLIIIPTYNEIDNVEKMVRALYAVSKDLSILIIDDNSPDGTSQKVEQLQSEFKSLNLIKRAGKLGLGTAYVAGFRFALEKNFDYIFEMDCDFSHDPEAISDFLIAAQNADLVIGSRYVNGIRVINWPMKRLLLSFFASIYTRIITGMPIQDATGGYKCFSRKALLTLKLDEVFSNGYSFQIELNFKIWAQGLTIKEIPIIFYERRDGQSKMNKKIVREAIFAVFKLRIKKWLNLL